MTSGNRMIPRGRPSATRLAPAIEESADPAQLTAPVALTSMAATLSMLGVSITRSTP